MTAGSAFLRNCNRLSQTFNRDSVFCRRTTTGAGWILLARRRRGETEDDCGGIDLASFQLVMEDGWPMDLDLRSCFDLDDPQGKWCLDTNLEG